MDRVQGHEIECRNWGENYLKFIKIQSVGDKTEWQKSKIFSIKFVWQFCRDLIFKINSHAVDKGGLMRFRVQFPLSQFDIPALAWPQYNKSQKI